jgi:uncharacterized Zn finger protein
MNPQVNQARMNVDLSSALDIVCDACGSRTFCEVVFMKRVSPLVSPTGKEAVVPVGTFSCASCGNVNREFDPFLPQVAKVE